MVTVPIGDGVGAVGICKAVSCRVVHIAVVPSDPSRIRLTLTSRAISVEAVAFLVKGKEAEETASDRDVLERSCCLNRVGRLAVEQQRRQHAKRSKCERR